MLPVFTLGRHRSCSNSEEQTWDFGCLAVPTGAIVRALIPVLHYVYLTFWSCSSAALAPVASAVHKLFEEDAPSVIPASYRTATEAIDITLTGVGCVIASYSYDIEHASAFQWATDSTVVFVIQDFEVIDKIASSPLNLVIG